MTRRCLVLFSGGLDSMLAVRILQEQSIEVEALNFKTAFTCCQDAAGQAAHRLGVKLTVVGTDDDYLDLIRQPRWGYGKGANPCVDCRIYMFDKAHDYLRQSGADFLASGEVVGQRPMSQKRRDLDRIAYHSGCEDLLLRPLSAKLLPPTLPEREGWVDREGLYDFVGRSRKRLIKLARQFGIEEIPSPSTGCALTEQRFSKKVFDLIQLDEGATRWDFELLSVGRHYRIDEQTKVIVGRHAEDNARLQYMHALPEAHSAVLLTPDGFSGPTALLISAVTAAHVNSAVGLIVRHAGEDKAAGGVIEMTRDGQKEVLPAQPHAEVESLQTIAAS